MKKILMLSLALSLALILAACSNDSADNDKQKDKDTEEAAGDVAKNAEVTDEEKVDEEESIVNVNGTEIKGDAYNSIYAQLKMQLVSNGQDVSDTDQLKDISIDALIEQELITQESEAQGLEVTEEEVESELKLLKSENEDNFEAFLEQYKMSEEDFKEEMTYGLLRDKYVAAEFPDLEVTDEEVKDLYDQAKEAQGDDVQEFDEIKDQIKAGLEQQKEQEAIQDKVEELQEKADIETLI